MKRKILACLFFLQSIIFSQNGAFASANLQQSPLLIGAGSIGAAIPNDDVFGFYLNPAILGYSARNNHFSFSVMPTKTDWFTQNFYYMHPASSSYPGLFILDNSEQPTFYNLGFNFGYNLKSTELKLPISIGFGYIYNEFQYGKVSYNPFDYSFREEQEKGDNYDEFNCFSIGVGIDYFVKFNMGFSIKSFNSKLSPFYDNPQNYIAEGTMMDYGALLIVPISDLILQEHKYEYDKSPKLKPITNFSFGFSSTNHGDEIYYIDKSQKYPLSRTARIGYTFEFGLDLILEKNIINLFKYSFTAEAEDLLIKYNDRYLNSGTKYQSGIGDIKLQDHLFFLIADEKVVVHKGHILNLFDTFTLIFGSLDGKNINPINKTSGVGISSKGIFNLLNTHTDNKVLKYITKHFQIDYIATDYDFNSMSFAKNNTVKFDALSIHFVEFEL